MESKSDFANRLAAELLDDLDLGRLNTEALLLKVSRLARLTGDEDIQKWLGFEMSGYNASDPVSLRYMSRTGRWTNRAEKQGYWGPLAVQEASLDAMKVQLRAYTTQGIGGDAAVGVVTRIAHQTNALTNQLAILSGIRSRVLALLHAFVVGAHYEAIFSGTAEGIFDQFRSAADPILQVAAAGLSERMAISYLRIGEGNPEATSAALNTCRRVIDSFADAVFPPRDESFQIDGQDLQVGANHHQNRLNSFVATRVESKTRRKRLRQSLANTYDRISAGIHDDIDPQEARALILNTYVLLGEIALLPVKTDGASTDSQTGAPNSAPTE